MPTNLLRLIAILPAIPLLVIGIGLVFQPGQAVASLGMPLLDGAALSTQLGDMTAFFLCTSAFILMGGYHAAPRWLFAGAALMIVVAAARTLAWLVHGAAFSAEPIIVEVVSTVWLVVCGLLLQRRADTTTATPNP